MIAKKVVWEVIEDNIVKYTKDNDDIGLRRFGFNFLMNARGGGIDKY